jgi:UDP-N-acetylmuramoyl-L-alanyl-D-glutamate--2,6-diaminopimelate ligase
MALSVPFVGAYNVSNLLGVICTLRAHGLSLADAVRACHVLTAVPGRMQVVQQSHDINDTSKQAYPLVLVDYAHTPDALVQAITALRPIVDLRKGRLHVVVGCGGDRDRLKRPLMARAAEQYADCIWLTSDNPRSEDPSQILQQMVAGLSHPDASHVIADRSEAIKAAIFAASLHDVILIAGKGHEVTQEIKGVKHPFSDVVQAQQALFHS